MRGLIYLAALALFCAAPLLIVFVVKGRAQKRAWWRTWWIAFPFLGPVVLLLSMQHFYRIPKISDGSLQSWLFLLPFLALWFIVPLLIIRHLDKNP